MGTGEESTLAKPSKPTASTQETPTTPSYPDWSTPMQAYYGAGATPPPFFTSTVASPTPHPYLWGSQVIISNHPLIPPYGTPFPYPALYPHGGIYAHPNMAAAQGAALINTEMEGKATDRKNRALTKKSKGSSGNIVLAGGKSGESGKAASDSGNDGASQTAESGSEGSSDASDDNTNQQELSVTKKRSFDQMLADGANAQNNTAQYSGANLPVSVPRKPAVPMPVANLNIGMDLWNASPAGVIPMKARPNASGVSLAVAPATMVGREGVTPEHQWIQDERELKRQRRKQSNRESARRSRLRKQAECEELQAKVETLSNENRALRDELQRLAEECEKLTSENNSIMVHYDSSSLHFIWTLNFASAWEVWDWVVFTPYVPNINDTRTNFNAISNLVINSARNRAFFAAWDIHVNIVHPPDRLVQVKVSGVSILIDGSVRGTLAGIGCVIRSTAEEPLVGIASGAEPTSILVVELMAIKRGMVEAVNSGIVKVEVQSDC
ncbi:hypothetical protein HHK36_002443 [Tetracentron sinense]|uniref:BZIP domain-containing protein n=1 Tax=Tetracentron sinense TaxID=13715 RepID=A0A835DR55_TETSI|nr:hypothetical protein HHK36_002443 [Tetracentron sinense]